MSITRQVLAEYRKQRKLYTSPLYGVRQGRAHESLEQAKRAVWVWHNWGAFDGDTVLSNDGQWRLRIVPDGFCMLEDLEGDMFDLDHASTVPGGLRTIEAKRKAFRARLERDGVWGYVLERKTAVCGTCGRGEEWEHVDSCFGFDGEVPEYELVNAQFQAKGD